MPACRRALLVSIILPKIVKGHQDVGVTKHQIGYNGCGTNRTIRTAIIHTCRCESNACGPLALSTSVWSLVSGATRTQPQALFLKHRSISFSRQSEKEY